jgi:peptidoglycan/LPS O-acetylase OafA/YrhL
VTLFLLVMAGVALGFFSWVKAPWIVTAGALTYPLYLIHRTVGVAVIDRVQAYLLPWLLITALTVCLLVAAWLIHRFVERPGARWMKRQLGNSMRQLRTSR